MRGLQPCVYCRTLIDDDLPWPHPQSRVIAHDRPIAEGGPALDPANCHPSHKVCNERAGTTPITGPVDHTTMRGGQALGDLTLAIHAHAQAEGMVTVDQLHARYPDVPPPRIRRTARRMVTRGQLIEVGPGCYALGPGLLRHADGRPRTMPDQAIHVDPHTL